MTSAFRRSIRRLAPAAVLLTFACKSSDTTTPEQQAIILALTGSTVAVTAGSSANVPVSVTRSGGFAGAVSVSASGTPSGVTIAPITIPAGQTSGTLNVAAAASAATGPATVTVQASAAGVATQSATFTLTVNAAPGFTISLNPTTVSVQAGGAGTAAVAIARTGGFSGSIALAATGMPQGLTATFDSTSFGGASATVRLAAGASVAAGSYPLTITGTGTGVSAQTATLTVQVTPGAGPGGFSLTLSPATLSVPASSTTGVDTIKVTRTGSFTGAVGLTVTGAPAGVLTTLDANSVTGTSTLLHLAVGASVPVGSYNLTVTGTGTGVSNQTATLTLQVTSVPGGFSLTLAPATLQVQAGASAVDTVKIGRTGSFTGPVGLAVTGAPTGMTVTLDSTSVGGGSTLLHVSPSSSVAAGSYNLTVTGTGTAVTTQNATLTVQVAAAAGGFTVTAAPASLSVQAGANAVDTIKIGRTGSFTGAVGLAVTGAPAGMTVTLDASSVTGGSTLLHVSPAGSVAAGSYTLTITGTAAGVTSQSATLTVQVTAVTGSGNVSHTFCGDLPIWVAVQDGSGPWIQITSTTNTYTFNVTTKGGLAYVTGSATSGYRLNVVYATTQEANAQGQPAAHCTTPTSPTKTVNGSVLGLGLTDQALVNLGGASASALGATGGNFTLHAVPAGTVDLMASRMALSGSAFVLNKLYLQRGLNPADGSTLSPIDFGSSLAFDPVTKQITIGNLGTDQAIAQVALLTANGSTLSYTLGGLPSTSTTASFPAVPTSMLITGDLHLAQVVTIPGAGNNSLRIAGAYFFDPADQTINLGPAITGATASVLTSAPYVRLRIAYATQPEYTSFWFANFSQAGATVGNTASIQVTAGYAAGATSLNLDIPDVSGAGGWNHLWALVTGVSTTWTMGAFNWTNGGIVTGPPANGTTFREAALNGTITP